MMRTYHGSCHCGQLRFTVELDLAAGTSRCNCSHCAKTRWWGAAVKPQAFRQLAGQDQATDYQFNTRQAHHSFCSRCGLAPFSTGDIPEIGGPYVAINVACLDDATPDELAAAPVRYCDGKHDNWTHPPEVTSYL